MSESWYIPSTPATVSTQPWLHPSATDYLERLLNSEWSVLEHGAGGSTVWFSERVKKVVSVEGDQRWRQFVREKAPANVVLLSGLPTPKYPDYDLFFIDGDHEGRAQGLLQAHLYVRPGGWVVLDNANRPEYRRERLKFSECATLQMSFDNNIPISKYFVTEFWQCASA